MKRQRKKAHQEFFDPVLTIHFFGFDWLDKVRRTLHSKIGFKLDGRLDIRPHPHLFAHFSDHDKAGLPFGHKQAWQRSGLKVIQRAINLIHFESKLRHGVLKAIHV